jgi:hypothetical protein
MQDPHAAARHSVKPHWGRPLRIAAALLLIAARISAQTPAAPETQPAPQTPTAAQPAATQPASPQPAAPETDFGPIAIVPIDSKNPDTAAMVKGALQISAGKAIIAASGEVTSGAATTEVTLPRRGVLRVCASTSVKLAADHSVPAGEVPGLMMVLEQGALEASFATGRNSDILLTPDFRILIGGPGAAEVKVRLGQHGDTCVDNAGVNAPYVLVASVFDGSIYRVQPGQRVMFQHGSLQEVVDQEKEPCGCPVAPRPNSNDFPLAQSAGLAPLPSPTPAVAIPTGAPPAATDTFVFNSAAPAPIITVEQPAAAPAAAAPSVPPQANPPAQKQPGFFTRLGRFFKRIFGAEQS